MENTTRDTNTNNVSNRQRPFWQRLVLFFIVAVVAYYALQNFLAARRADSNRAILPQMQVTQPASGGSAPTAAGTQVTVVGSEFAFTPATITAKAGQPIRLTFKNVGGYPHNLVISDLNVSTQTIRQGQEDTVEFTPAKKGSFRYICTVTGHADKGMVGTLKVE